MIPDRDGDADGGADVEEDEKRKHLTQLVKDWQTTSHKLEKKQLILEAMIKYQLATLETSQYTFTISTTPNPSTSLILKLTQCAETYLAQHPEACLEKTLPDFIQFFSNSPQPWKLMIRKKLKLGMTSS